MGMPVGLKAAAWSSSEPVGQAAQHLVGRLFERFPDAAEIAANDPTAAVRLVPDLELLVVAAPPPGACALGALYDDRTKPARIIIRASGNPARDNFSILHELGHHLMAEDETWQYDVRPHLEEKQRRPVEEAIVNCFASEVLIPQPLVEDFLAEGVTAQAIWELEDHCMASVAACCIRAAQQPGERLVLIADTDGRVMFSAPGGGPYPPKRGMAQRDIADAAQRAGEDDSYTLIGGHGLQYATGNTYTDVAFDVHRRANVVVCVVTSTRTDHRISRDHDATGDCERCGATFPATSSSGFCTRCDSWKCPDCHTCGCAKRLPVCDRCWIELSTSEAQAGLARHRDCM